MNSLASRIEIVMSRREVAPTRIAARIPAAFFHSACITEPSIYSYASFSRDILRTDDFECGNSRKDAFGTLMEKAIEGRLHAVETFYVYEKMIENLVEIYVIYIDNKRFINLAVM